jgi:hypothetical protein
MEVQTLREWNVYYSDLIQRVRVIPKMEAGDERRERFCSRLFLFFGSTVTAMFASAAVPRNEGLTCVGRETQSGRRSVQKKSRVAPDCEPCADRPDGQSKMHLPERDHTS